MLTQEELNRDYVDGPAAAKMLKVTTNHVRLLCATGKLKGAMKLGTSGWIIPRASVLNYVPGRKGPKPKPSHVRKNKRILEQAIKEADNLKNGTNNG